ncbi:SGNH/GDSL hydrolase family protein [Paraburkholderia sp. Tr-20389]|uniref:SGNH/GDSL hydrolase family protein n=1 Tax=Paraburkholderia sp. Tr-20389 TaxID=2703903 RepID=UPI00197D3E8D|nr:SGNH/GDSL hydrolase family protein [Paraburkholderia sp. Tr-20389]MBN3752287.1 SGNH/GDSL hydrolase family protein [Paraburkholderia sp. Tr-20389]
MNAHKQDGEAPGLHRRLMRYDPILGYRFAPGLKLRIPHEGGGYLVKTNRDGFRCDHQVTPRKQTAHRVLVFGDSYTAGDGVSNGKRYTDVMEQQLNDTEVLNFGLSGSGTDQQYLVFQQYADQIDYDAVVISVLVENIQRNVVRERGWADRAGEAIRVPKPWFELSDDNGLTLKGIPVPQPYSENDLSHPPGGGMASLRSNLRKMVNKIGPDFKDLCQRITRFQPLPEYNAASNDGWRLMQAILEKWVSELPVPAVIAVMPVYQYVEETASYKNIRKRFDELAQSVDVLVYHVIDDLQRYPAGQRRQLRFRMDCHYTPTAHDLMGRALAKVVAPLIRAGVQIENGSTSGAMSGIVDERQISRYSDPGKQEPGGGRPSSSQGVAT